MKKLRLKALSLGAREILSREQLRTITGGQCSTDNDCPSGSVCTSLNECSSDPYSGGSGQGSGSGDPCYATSGDMGTCPIGTATCHCGSSDMGCLSATDCGGTICIPCPF
jgi:hypothetical protein